MSALTPARVSVLMFGTVITLVLAYVAKSLVATETAPPAPETRNVPMALGLLEPGTVITPAHIGMGPVRIDRLEPDHFINREVLEGRIVKQQIQPATPIRSSQLFQPGDRPPLEVREGMRAVSVNLGESVAIVDGLVKPGEFVDVHFTVSNSSDSRLSGPLTLTLFEGVRVIAINRSFQQGRVDRSGNAVTLELTPEQSNIVLLARQNGSLSLTFNPNGPGEGGVAVSRADRATLEEILGLDPEPEVDEGISTEIFRGGSREQIRFRDGRRIEGRGIETAPPSRGTRGRPRSQQGDPRPADEMRSSGLSA